MVSLISRTASGDALTDVVKKDSLAELLGMELYLKHSGFTPYLKLRFPKAAVSV